MNTRTCPALADELAADAESLRQQLVFVAVIVLLMMSLLMLVLLMSMLMQRVRLHVPA